jgi:hypothetical protein
MLGLDTLITLRTKEDFFKLKPLKNNSGKPLQFSALPFQSSGRVLQILTGVKKSSGKELSFLILPKQSSGKPSPFFAMVKQSSGKAISILQRANRVLEGHRQLCR